MSAPGTQGAAGAAAPPPCETPALRQIAKSAQALFHEGKTDETWEFFLAALEAVLVQNRDLTLLVAKLRRAARGTTSEPVDLGHLALLFEALVAEGTAAVDLDPEAEATEDAALDRDNLKCGAPHFQLVASTSGPHKKANTAGNSVARCAAKRRASGNAGAVSMRRPRRASRRPAPRPAHG